MSVKLKGDVDAVAPSTPVALFEVDVLLQGFVTPYTVAPDGKRFLVRVPVESGGQPLEVVLNWPALLEKGAQ